MLTIYGNLQSRTSRCLWALEELGLAYRREPLVAASEQTRTEDYRALNPSGKVPTLVDGDFVLTESVAITYYLASKAPSPLWPTTPHALARVFQWSNWAATDLELPLSTIMREMRRATAAGTPPDQEVIGSALGAAAVTLGSLEAYLANGPQFIAGDDFSVGDINTAVSVSFVAPRVDMAAYPATKAWLERSFSRPAWQRVQANG
ncbi:MULTISPECIES: glutathione S-transferase family protein [Pseudomonas]|uniref:glutathione S-transferase family protein n=1 Tax=Pseudomonas TaxID=286 RepID=UPI000722DC7C|nr:MULTISPECIES: glutathione S-transferase family protein [Pseudomonas]ALQ02614.1 Glutathione S-transferase [Pseudomonas brassicacearum]